MTAQILSSGPVFWTLAALGAVSVAIFARRLMSLRRARVDGGDFTQGVRNLLERGNPDEALAVCDDTPSPIARIVATAVTHRSGSARALREAVDAVGRAESARLFRRIAFLALVAQIAPLLGLLGAVLGMIKAVVALDSAALVVRADLTSALLSALVPVASGLLVAIPVQVMYVILRGHTDRFVLELEAAASDVLAVLAARREAGK